MDSAQGVKKSKSGSIEPDGDSTEVSPDWF